MSANLTQVSIPFAININGAQQEFSLDLWEAKLLCERLEAGYSLPIIDGCYKPSIEFLNDLQCCLQDIGAPDLTPSITVQVWMRINATFAAHVEQLAQANAQAKAKPGFVKAMATKLFGGLNRHQRRKLAARSK